MSTITLNIESTSAAMQERCDDLATLPDATHAASVRITLADDGHYYLDVRAGKSAAFRAHSRHGDLDAALGRARAVLALEPAA